MPLVVPTSRLTTTSIATEPANKLSPRQTDMGERHNVGHIQSCGYLFVMKEDAEYPSGLRILCMSSNMDKAPWMRGSGVAKRDLLGNDLGLAFRQECVATISALVERHKRTLRSESDHNAEETTSYTAITHLNRRVHAELQPTAHGEALTCTLVGSRPAVYILEIEQKHGPLSARASPMQGLLQVADVLGCVAEGCSPEASAGALCEALMENLPAYDRILAYRFSGDMSGEVIYEAFRPGFEAQPSLLNHRFSAEDWPPEVAELLELNVVFFVSDTSAPSVPVESGGFGDEDTQLNLSMSVLRAPPEHHLRHLRKIGVKTSLAVAVLVGGDLWGIYSCQSFTRVVSPTCEERAMVGMAATTTAVVVSHFEREQVSRAT